MPNSLFNEFDSYSEAGRAIADEFEFRLSDWLEVLAKTHNTRELELICLDTLTGLMAEIRIKKAYQVKKERKRGEPT